MKLRFLFGLAAAAALSTSAFADVYTNENGQRMDCHDEQVVTKKGDHPIVAPLVGAAAGGVIGHQIGGGHGKDIATGVGAVGGAAVGKNYNDNTAREESTTRRVCTPVNG